MCACVGHGMQNICTVGLLLSFFHFMSRLIFFFCVPLLASAGEVTLPLSGVAGRVRTHHPMLQAARLLVDEARGRQLGAGRLSNPSLGLNYRSESRLSPTAGEFSFEQAFPVTRRLTLEKKLTSQLVVAAEFEVRDAERRYVAEARTLAVKLLALDKQRALRLQQVKLARELSEFTAGRAQKGELSPLDAAQAQVDAQRLLLDVRRFEVERLSLLGLLKPMLGLKPEQALQLSGELPALLQPGVVPWQHRADYQLAKTKEQAAQTEAELARSRRMEDVSVGLVGGPEQQHLAGEGYQRTGYIGFRISLPLPFWNRNQGEMAEKKAAAERQRLEAEALGQQIAAEAETARQEMKANASLAKETHETLLPLVLAQTSKLEKAYENGQTDLLTVLRAREQRLQLEAAALDAARDFHLARIRYEAATGATQP